MTLRGSQGLPPKGRSFTARSMSAPYGRGIWADSSTGGRRRPEAVPAQDPGVVLEETEGTGAGGSDVAVLVHQQEQPSCLRTTVCSARVSWVQAIAG